MQKLINGVFTDCTQEDLNDNDIYRISVGGDGWQEQAYFTPIATAEPVTLNIKSDKENNVMFLGETLNFTATFSDITINASVPVSIVNRDGAHVSNAIVIIKDGIGTGTFTPSVAIDYFVTEKGINFHTESLPNYITLNNPFFIRVIQA